jgi:hypothetical protein
VAWERAICLEGGAATPDRAVGLAVTASLKTSRPKRGGHRICAAVQTLDGTFSAELVLTKDARSRADEELVAAALALDLLTKAVGLPAESQGVILAVDRVLDMGRTAVNVWSDVCGAAVIDAWEGPDSADA